MRRELSAAVAGVIARCDPEAILELTDEETDRLLAAADLVTLARTGVEYDYRGDVIDAHAPEMPDPFRQATCPDRARRPIPRHDARAGTQSRAALCP